MHVHRVNTISRRRLPEWLRKQIRTSETGHKIKRSLRRRSLHTVCEEARCPNICECFERGAATFMILGRVCTRRCGFCAVVHGMPLPIDRDEPRRVAEHVEEMGLRHVVITSVTRDDLTDGGAGHFAQTIREVRRKAPVMKVEVLTPDFEGRERDVETVCSAGPDVFNHNVETVRRLTPIVRDRADYGRSLGVLATAKRYLKGGMVKSGLMLGLGEDRQEVEMSLHDLRKAGCDIVTIGQYLQPTRDALPVAQYIRPEVFGYYQELGLRMGFKSLLAGPFVRSSYLADKESHTLVR